MNEWKALLLKCDLMLIPLKVELESILEGNLAELVGLYEAAPHLATDEYVARRARRTRAHLLRNADEIEEDARAFFRLLQSGVLDCLKTHEPVRWPAIVAHRTRDLRALGIARDLDADEKETSHDRIKILGLPRRNEENDNGTHDSAVPLPLPR
jgi:hypothetical protein